MAQLVYEVSFKGAASDMLAGAFEGCRLSTAHGITVVRTELPDQTALQGLLSRVHALGLELLDLHLVAEPRDVDAWALPPTDDASRPATAADRNGVGPHSPRGE